LRNHWENYGSSGRIREAMAASYPGVESINEGAPSARHPAGTKKWQDWNASLAIAVAREEQGRQNTQSEYDGQFNQWTAEANQGLISPELARSRLEQFRKGGPLNHKLAGASTQVQTSFMESLRNAAGYGGEAPTITAGQKAVSDQITNKEAADNARLFVKDKKTGEDVALDGIPTHRMNSLKQSFADTYRYWASGIADDLIASGVRPEDVEAEINAMIRTGDPRTKTLEKLMQADWYDSNNPDVRLKVPNFPNMRKPRGKDEKGFVEEYNADRFATQKAGQTFDYDDINWNHPIIERFFSQVDRAKRYKHINLQNVLSNAPQAIKHIVNTQKFSSAGQVYQAGLDHGIGYGDKYTRLSESDYMDYNEVQQQYNVLGSQLSKLDERAKAIVLARQEANGGQFPLNATASNVTGDSIHAYTTGNIGGSGPHLDIKRLQNQGEWNLNILDKYVYLMDPVHGKVTLSQLRGLTGNVGDSWKEHASRSTPSRGWDIGALAGTKLYLQNGAEVISNAETPSNGDMSIIEIPGEGRFKIFHGRGIN